MQPGLRRVHNFNHWDTAAPQSKYQTGSIICLPCNCELSAAGKPGKLGCWLAGPCGCVICPSCEKFLAGEPGAVPDNDAAKPPGYPPTPPTAAGLLAAAIATAFNTGFTPLNGSIYHTTSTETTLHTVRPCFSHSSLSQTNSFDGHNHTWQLQNATPHYHLQRADTFSRRKYVTIWWIHK